MMAWGSIRRRSDPQAAAVAACAALPNALRGSEGD